MQVASVAYLSVDLKEWGEVQTLGEPQMISKI